MININTGVVIFNLILKNEFYNLYCYVTISFVIQSSGLIEKRVDVMSFMLDLYAEERIYKVIWEAFFLIFFIWSWKHLYTGWKELFDDEVLVK